MKVTWNSVGQWIQDNTSNGVKLVGSLVSGNVPAAIAAGVSMITGATGTDNPDEALAALQGDPEAVLKLQQLYIENEQSVRAHLEIMTRFEYENDQHEHEQTQITIRGGDVALDERIRWTRPKMAKESWFATIAYVFGCWGVQVLTQADYFNIYIAGILSSPAWAYLGLRTGDKFALAWKDKK